MNISDRVSREELYAQKTLGNARSPFFDVDPGNWGPSPAMAPNVTYAERPPESFVEQLTNRIGTVQMIVADVYATLSTTRGRILGQIPRPDTARGREASKPNGQAAEIISLLDELIYLANETRDEARTLENRL